MKQDQFILSSKVNIPPRKPDTVTRHKLIQKLDRLFEPGIRIAFVLSPPGFGKSSLVTDWAHHHQLEVAWISVDETDNSPSVFWQYLKAAIQQTFDRVSNQTNGKVPDLRNLDFHPGLIHLINKMTSADRNLVIVLDDLHHITNPVILSELKFLIDHLPSSMKMVITSHREPDWSLTRFRADGALIEIRVDDLEFSKIETVDLLRRMNVGGYSDHDVTTLVEDSEGWVFGIQLAAIAAAENKGLHPIDPANPLIHEYLASEVFTSLAPDVQEFLKQISVLDSLTAPLCAFITGRTDAEKLLRFLEQKNLFLMPVDADHRWYRFHRLFLDLLRIRLKDFPSEDIRALQMRASEWYEKSGRITTAVDHALRAEDYERAVALVENNIYKMMDQTELVRQSELVSQLPDAVLRSRPDLTIANAWLLAYSGRCEDAEDYLSMAGDSLKSLNLKSDRRRVEGRILAVQSYVHWLRGDDERTIKSAGQALINLGSDDKLDRAVTLTSLATALENRGHLNEALDTFTEAMDTCCASDCTHIYILAAAAKVRLLVILGQLQQADLLASATIKRVLEKNPGKADQFPALGNLYSHRAEIFRFRNNLPAALEMASEGARLGELWGQADTTITTQGIKAAVLWTQGKPEETLRILEEIKPLAALVSRWYLNYLGAFLVLLGMNPAQVHCESKWLDIDETVSESEFNLSVQMLCRARVRMLYSNGRYAEAMKWLELIQKDAEVAGARLWQTDCLVTQAICYFNLGDKETALEKINAAFEYIGLERAYSIILDKGEAARTLLTGLHFEPPLEELVNKLLDLSQESSNLDLPMMEKKQSLLAEKPCGLSAREREILGYLATHKTSVEIAEGLTVSPNTIRFHIKSIYNKLDVHSRDEAIERARQLDLI